MSKSYIKKNKDYNNRFSEIEKEKNENIKKQTTVAEVANTIIICRNVNCRFNRRFLGDLHCNFKHITMNERGECIHKEERSEHQSDK